MPTNPIRIIAIDIIIDTGIIDIGTEAFANNGEHSGLIRRAGALGD